MNKIILIGNIVRDPELSTTPNGIEKCNFTVACTRRIANKDGQRETDFFNCTAWRKTAAFIARYFHKGEKIAVEGSMQCRKYTAQDGTNRTAWDVQVDNAEFCTSRMSAAQTVPDEPAQDDPFMDAADDSELPF